MKKQIEWIETEDGYVITRERFERMNNKQLNTSRDQENLTYELLTSDGKYHTLLKDGYKIVVYRNGEPWIDNDQYVGDGYVLSLIQAHEDKDLRIQKLLNELYKSSLEVKRLNSLLGENNG